jgi:8-oxo-dGTP diphosphatase
MKEVAVGILLRNGQVLACQRKRSVRYPLKWEFPGGKIEAGETAREAVIRELHEELDIHAQPHGELLTHDWVYRESTTGREPLGAFRVTYFIVRSFSGQIVNRTFEAIRWVTPRELEQMDVLEGNRVAIDLLLKRQKSDGSPL